MAAPLGGLSAAPQAAAQRPTLPCAASQGRPVGPADGSRMRVRVSARGPCQRFTAVRGCGRAPPPPPAPMAAPRPCWPPLRTLRGWPGDPQTRPRGAARAAVWGSPLTGERPAPLAGSPRSRPPRRARSRQRGAWPGAPRRRHRCVSALGLFVASPPQHRPSYLAWSSSVAFVGRCGLYSAHARDGDELKAPGRSGRSRRLETVREGGAPRWSLLAGPAAQPPGLASWPRGHPGRSRVPLDGDPHLGRQPHTERRARSALALHRSGSARAARPSRRPCGPADGRATPHPKGDARDVM